MRAWITGIAALSLVVGCAGGGSTGGEFGGSATGTVETGNVCIRGPHLPMSKTGELCFKRTVGHTGQCVTVLFHTPGDIHADGRTYLPVDSTRVATGCGA